MREAMNEKWADIPNTKGKLQVSDMGRVRSCLRGDWRILKTQTDNKGYERLTYTFEREKRREKVHRLVAKTFLPAQKTKQHVNHLNGNKSDNRASNLEWCSNRENVHHAISSGLWDCVFAGAKESNHRRKRALFAINIKSGAVHFFESVSDAERACDTRHISAVLKGKRSKANGFVFKYAG